MNNTIKVLLLMIGSIVIIGILSVGIAASSYFKYHDVGVRTEQQLKAEYERAQNTMSATATTVMDVSKISERYADDVRSLVRETMSGRYGDDGSDAVMQWIQEQNIELDSTMYRDITQVIRSGRQDFRNAQDRVIDIKRSYERNIDALWSGFWLKLAGFPKIDLDDYNILLDQSTIDRYESGVDSSFL